MSYVVGSLVVKKNMSTSHVEQITRIHKISRMMTMVFVLMPVQGGEDS